MHANWLSDVLNSLDGKNAYPNPSYGEVAGSELNVYFAYLHMLAYNDFSALMFCTTTFLLCTDSNGAFTNSTYGEVDQGGCISAYSTFTYI